MLLAARSAFLAQKKKLPFDSAVEYLESTGTQWIDTGVKANNFTSVEIHFAFTRIFNDNAVVSMDSGSANLNAFTLEYYYKTTSKWGIAFSFDGSGAMAYKGTTESELTQFNIIASANGIVVNGESYPQRSTPDSFSCPYSLLLFTYGRNGLPIIFGESRINYCCIYDKSTLVRDFIPVRVGQTGYMYDRVSRRLFGNKGTGNFLYGQDVKVKL